MGSWPNIWSGYTLKVLQTPEDIISWFVPFKLLVYLLIYSAAQPLEELSAYSQSHIHPALSSRASDKLITSYVSLRAIGANEPHATEKHITAPMHQLESMIHLS